TVAVDLLSTAILDDRGFLAERVWTLHGSEGWEQHGFLRLVEADQPVAVGPSGQIGPPGQRRPMLASWEPVDPVMRE
ncbi:MAG: hypothetical protein KC656_33605, partial [Myxococcales bacterium]|nr:hypothetical protein [Myxococcales bacterium]